MNQSATPNNFGFPVCPCCECPALDVKTRRRNTAYVDDDLNFLTSCGRCAADDYEYYAEQWQEYYQSRL